MMIDSSLLAALNQPFVRAFFAVHIQLVDRTLKLIDGSGEVTFPINSTPTLFTSNDEVYGSLSQLQAITESITESAPRTLITIFPHDESVVPYLVHPSNQGSLVHVFEGAVNEDTGAVIGNPTMLFRGKVDYCQIKAGAKVLSVDINVISSFESLFRPSSNLRLNNQWQRQFYPADTSLGQTATPSDNLYWGGDKINTSSARFVTQGTTAIGRGRS